MMTAERRRSSRVYGWLVTAGMAILGYMAVNMWNSKANVLDLQAQDARQTINLQNHIQAEQMLRLEDSLWKEDEHAMVLELLCHQMPKSRRCTDGRNN